MAKINVLDSSVYNRIAAGEVVERPFSVVKELVENSIDAGAKNISVEIVDGGITSIKITDDGCGIEKSELKKALLPHATSKIAAVDDLDAILTLGFRGEALASIASVSRMKIASKPAMQEFGAFIASDGGAVSDTEDCGLSDGTEITVNNLFFNTPARQKFLKTPKGEEGDISNIVTRFILGNPSISFRYTANGKLIYQSYGDGLESAMLNVYGKSAVENCFFIDTERHGIRLSGYIGKHHFTKPNRTYQSMFINGRYVINSTLNSAVTNAYGAYLMKRQYPFYVLNLSVPSEIVDVNVHPNKTDVRFSNNQIVYGSVYSIISKVLDGSSEAVNIVKETQSGNFSSIPIASEKEEKSEEIKKDNHNDYVKYNPNFNAYDLTKVVLNDHTRLPKINDAKPAPSEKAKALFEENKKYIDELFAEEKRTANDIIAEKMQKFAPTERKEQQKIEFQPELKLIGQALDTFLILEDGKDLYFIDQHAAHERVLFDRFYEKALEGSVAQQSLLVPYTFSVNEQENEFIKSKLSYFNELGIETEEFGYNAYKISALPTEFADMDVKAFLDDCMHDMNLLKNETVPNLIREKIAGKACKSAVKSGDFLDENNMESLLKMLKGNLGLKCPHGRPIAIKITRAEIDKWFKRIV
ncbi:MAG: DNA mismatch repair endonuclease MutL [Bacillota bacterium]|nr:MAG: DNA mismatch repair endonuclease MutL [Bacillota bacterium]